MLYRRLPILLSLLRSPLVAWAGSQCYYPDGDESSDFPCDPNADASPCCGGGLGNVCLSNNLCQSSSGNIIRGSCSDQNWGEGCPLFCLSASTGGTDLISCSNVTQSDTSYCCDHTNGCCNSGVGRFSVLPSNPVTSATWNQAASAYTVIASSTSTTTTTSSTSSSTSSTETSSTASLTAAASNTISSTSSGTTSDPSATSGPNTSSGGLSTATSAGIGAGVGVGVIALACGAFFAFRSRQKKKAANSAQLVNQFNQGTPAPKAYEGSSNHQSSQGYAYSPQEIVPNNPQELAWNPSPPPQELDGHPRSY